MSWWCNDGASKDNLHFDDQSKEVVSLFFTACFVKETENMFMFLLSCWNTGSSLGELKKAVETLTTAPPTAFLILPNFHLCFYLNNRVFLSRNYRLIVAPRKFDVLKTNICPRTSNFQGVTIRLIVLRCKHCCFYCSLLNFPLHANSKTNRIIFNFLR